MLTRPYYGESGQKSIDPVVFFKLCLVGHLENIISDRMLITHCSLRLDILYFIGYDIEEELPWHSIIIPFKKVFLDSRTKTKKKSCRASSKICKGCPLRSTCLGKVNEKQFSVTYFRAENERNIERIKSTQGRYMKGKRQSIVEPVFGALTQFMGLRKINTIGIKQANKVMHLLAIAYNLKKYMKFEQNGVQSGLGKRAFKVFVKSVTQHLFLVLLRHQKLTFQY